MNLIDGTGGSVNTAKRKGYTVVPGYGQDGCERSADLLATLKQVAGENREREARLYKMLEDERRAASERETRIKGELAELREMVEKAMAARLVPPQRARSD